MKIGKGNTLTQTLVVGMPVFVEKDKFGCFIRMHETVEFDASDLVMKKVNNGYELGRKNLGDIDDLDISLAKDRLKVQVETYLDEEKYVYLLKDNKLIVFYDYNDLYKCESLLVKNYKTGRGFFEDFDPENFTIDFEDDNALCDFIVIIEDGYSGDCKAALTETFKKEMFF